MAFLGVDLGTTSCDVVILDEDGSIVSESSVENKIVSEKKGFSEQSPQRWKESVQKAIEKATSKPDEEYSIKSLGVTGLGGGFLPLDTNMNPLRNSILAYADKREVEETANLKGGEKMLYDNLLWIKKNEKRLYDKIEYIIDARDYVGLLLTGNIRRNSFGFKQERLEELNKRFEIPDDFFPQTITYEETLGELKAPFSEMKGLSENTSVTVGPWDQITSALGAGITKENQAIDDIGFTAIRSISKPKNSPESNKNYLIESINLKSDWQNLKPAREQLRRENKAQNMHLNEKQLKDVKAPVLTTGDLQKSERTVEYSGKELVKAYYEVEAFQLKRFVEKSGSEIKEIKISGGGSENEYWNQLRADITGKRVLSFETEKSSAVGAATLAANTERPEKLEETVDRLLPESKIYEPREDIQAKYERKYSEFLSKKHLS